MLIQQDLKFRQHKPLLPVCNQRQWQQKGFCGRGVCGQMGMAAETERHNEAGAAKSLSAVGRAQQYTCNTSHVTSEMPRQCHLLSAVQASAIGQ